MLTPAPLKIRAKVTDAAVHVTDSHTGMNALLFLYPEILTFSFLIFLTCLRAEDTFSVHLLTASASERRSPGLSVALGRLATFRPCCWPFACDLVGLASLLSCPRITVHLWQRLVIKQIHIQSRDRCFAF